MRIGQLTLADPFLFDNQIVTNKLPEKTCYDGEYQIIIEVSMRPDLNQFVGKKFNMLTVESFGIKKLFDRNRSYLNCVCDCGARVSYLATLVVNLERMSCGCERLNKCIQSVKKHKSKPARAYRVWKNIRSRCNNPKTPGFKNYGGRGIKLHKDIEGFSDFYEHIKTILPEGCFDIPKGMSIDRSDNNKGYEPGNLRITNRVVQNRNRRNVVEVKIGEKSMIVADWLKRIGISHSLYRGRLRIGWSIEKALTTPKMPKI